MPPLGSAAKNYDITAQLHFLPYAKTSKVCLKLYGMCWFWYVKPFQFRPILTLQAQICKSYPKNYIGAHLQFNIYRMLVEFHL